MILVTAHGRHVHRQVLSYAPPLTCSPLRLAFLLAADVVVRCGLFRACVRREVSCAAAYLVQLLDGTVEGGVPVLLVHVVVACPGLVSHPHAKVLHSRRLLLKDLHSHQGFK